MLHRKTLAGADEERVRGSHRRVKPNKMRELRLVIPVTNGRGGSSGEKTATPLYQKLTRTPN
jgi:hypothetical protein